MTNARVPQIECDQQHTSVFVADLEGAIEFYVSKLGFTLAFTWGDPPSFAGVNLDRTQIFLDQSHPPDPAGCCLFFNVGNVDALYEFHRANGVAIAQEIADRPWHIRDYTVRDLHGYHIVFGQHLLDAGTPSPIERVDMHVRLEKRLAALVEDLAAHKRMTLTSCLEEILLHTNDGTGPHTTGTLRYIQELKRKHGIDYDTHGSYRFVEP
jgi:catechol 2,3-dioxygenase-like lactoylglutathione lyase family enzyme